MWRLVGNGLKKGGQIQGNRDCLSVLVILAAYRVTIAQRRGGGGVGILYGRTRFGVLSIAKMGSRGILGTWGKALSHRSRYRLPHIGNNSNDYENQKGSRQPDSRTNCP